MTDTTASRVVPLAKQQQDTFWRAYIPVEWIATAPCVYQRPVDLYIDVFIHPVIHLYPSVPRYFEIVPGTWSQQTNRHKKPLIYTLVDTIHM